MFKHSLNTNSLPHPETRMVNVFYMVVSFLCSTLISGTINSPAKTDKIRRFIVSDPCSTNSLPRVHHGHYECNSTRPTVGDICTLSCSHGYAPRNGMDTIRCIRHNHWSEEGECDEVSCVTPLKPAHGSYSCKSSSRHHVGSTCDLTCDLGYQTVNRSSSETITCGIDGRWSNILTCVDPYCHNLPFVANGVYVCPSGNHPSGTTCQLYCSKSHRVVGNDILTCGSNQQWSSPASCAEIQCSKPPELQDGAYICPPSPYTHGTMCQLQCAAGHRPVTDITNITCTADETWSPATTCTEGCLHGSYVKTNPTGETSCETCAVGTYQSKPDSPSCDVCPAGWTTLGTGSVSVNSCLSICHPGTFSPNGLEPCHLCTLGTYQNMTGSQDCDPCPVGKTTGTIGSAQIEDCIDK